MSAVAPDSIAELADLVAARGLTAGDVLRAVRDGIQPRG